MPHAAQWTDEVRSGERFRFGKNWRAYLRVINDERIAEAEKSLRHWLGVERLDGRSLLDIGSGSGLFSLAARRLGASVVSFDYDPDSVQATTDLRGKHAPNDRSWTVCQGSVLDPAFMATLDAADVVYSWGVLHHTGNMRAALETAAKKVKPGGLLWIAIYNDQGGASRRWRAIKKAYNRAGAIGRSAILAVTWLYFASQRFAARLVNLRRLRWEPIRGMTAWHDHVDWIGGYPFEVARPEDILDLYRPLGFELERLKTCGGGLGCCEYVLRRA